MNINEVKEVTIKELYDLVEKSDGSYQIETPSGFINIGDVYKKLDKICYKINFDDESFLESSEDHLIKTNKDNDKSFLKDGNYWVYSKDIKSGDLVYNKDSVVGVVSKELIGVHDTYDLEVLSDTHEYYSNGIISHNTGKTAIVEGLVQKIINQDVPFGLSNKVIWSLDAGSITAGTQYRGQMEERLKKILTEVEEDENIILFIDEIHMILDSGSSSSLNIANIMKPYLTSGKLQVIGATTHDEYTKIFEKDNALSRRFHKMIVNEPSVKDCIDILKNCVPHYEDYHNVKYNDDVLTSLPTLAKKYIQDRYLPDSAIDVIDEVGARIKAKRTLPSKKLLKLQEELVNKEKLKMDIVRNEDWDIVPKFIPQLEKLKEKVELERDKFELQIRDLENYEINESDILKVLASISNIPLDKLSEDGKENIKRLQKVLSERIIGQDEASKLVLKAIKRNVIGFNQPDKPIANFLFMGKTGTGKCFTKDGKITVRNKETGKVETMSVGEFKTLAE